MNCVTAQQLIRAYLDGYLSDRELEDFLNHVQTCPDCFDELEVYYSIYRTLNDVDEKGDYNFKNKLRRKLEGSRAYLRRRNQSKAFKVALIFTAEFALAAAWWGIVTFSDVNLTWDLWNKAGGGAAVMQEYMTESEVAAEESEAQAVAAVAESEAQTVATVAENEAQAMAAAAENEAQAGAAAGETDSGKETAADEG